jgi:hypothetical protein
MNRFWQILLGIELSSPGVIAGEDSRLEFVALPKGAVAVGLIVAGLAVLALVWWLYRRERRELSPTKRVLLVGLRALTLGCLAVMLIEPVLVSSRKETIPSHLAVVVDDSESMKFSDPYTDNSKAAEIATGLRLVTLGGKSPVQRLRETPRIGLVQSALDSNLEALGRGRELFVYDLETASRPGAGASARSRKLDEIKPSRSVSPLGDALHGVLSAHRGQPVAGLILATDGRSNAGEEPLRAVEAAARQGIPVYPIAAGADEGPRNVRLSELEVSPVVFVRDPTTISVVAEARGLKDAEAKVIV